MEFREYEHNPFASDPYRYRTEVVFDPETETELYDTVAMAAASFHNRVIESDFNATSRFGREALTIVLYGQVGERAILRAVEVQRHLRRQAKAKNAEAVYVNPNYL